MTELFTIHTSEGLELQAEMSATATPRARVVLCHPHPLHGGTMQSLVISELFTGLAAAEMTCLRFNFRGVGASSGTHDSGDGERSDVRSAIEALTAAEPRERAPLVVVGWSFGADVALSTPAPELAGWVAIAPPLASVHDLELVANDPRPKLILLAERDEVRPASEIEAITSGWRSQTTEVIAGASHFFVGRTDQLVEHVVRWVDNLHPE